MNRASKLESRIAIEVLAGERDLGRERRELRALLSAPPRRIPSRYFYDEVGSRLFDEITRLPEYYLTRAESAILERHARAIIERTRATELVELGSGTSTKTRILLDAMAAAHRLHRYIPFDVSESAVRGAAEELAVRYPELRIHGIVGEFDQHLPQIPAGECRLVLLIGSTIGNFESAEATRMLAGIAEPMRTGDWFLLGADLVKDASILEAAYNDAAGVTARFNLNVLDVLNTTFAGDFDTNLFEHRAVYNREREWIEMRLVAREPHEVRLDFLEAPLQIAGDEEILTEISCKYRREVIEKLLADSGFELAEWLVDDQRRFGLALARRL